jgi:hypothetical protein
MTKLPAFWLTSFQNDCGQAFDSSLTLYNEARRKTGPPLARRSPPSGQRSKGLHAG